MNTSGQRKFTSGRRHQRLSHPRLSLLATILAALLGGMSGPALAQDAAAALKCTDQACTSDGRPVIRVIERAPAPAGSAAAVAVPEWQGSGAAAIELPGGGRIWATEDPQLVAPQLTASAPGFVAFDGDHVDKPVNFSIFSNYAAFADHFELLVYRGDDTDLVTPLARVEAPSASQVTLTWDGELKTDVKLRAGDDLQYVLRAHAPDGSVDETQPRRIQLVRPADAERMRNSLLSARSGELANATADDIQARQLALDSFGHSTLRLQNIRVYGSRIRIRGERLAEHASVRIDGNSVPVDRERRFSSEYLLPIGNHDFALEVAGEGVPIQRSIPVDVTGRYLFLVALADLTVSDNHVGGAVVPVGIDDRYDEFLTEGRLAFYLKGKVRGKYLVTAQADTREQQVSSLFNGFLEHDARDVFRRLDPDQYYPVYGDDSSTYRDVDTQGKLYVRVDWDQNQAIWGNYQTGLTGTEFGQYTRSLYGGALSWRTRGANPWGEAKGMLRVFGSQAQTAPGHSEFLGTGGSLYYLRHTDLLPGSDQVVLEVRDPLTGRVETRVSLVRDVDYEIDELQGRLILTRPLAQIVRDNLPTITRDAPIDGFENRLLVDYEYIPQGFSPDDLAAGFRGKAWLGDHVAVGGTYVEENRSGEDYTLAGADLTLQAGRGTYLKIEQGHSQATGVPVFFSDNGGLSFTRLDPVTGLRSGDARSVEVRANLHELGWTTQDWTVGAWWREVDPGFSVSRLDIGTRIQEQGAEFTGRFSESLRMQGRYSRAERGADQVEDANLQLEWRPGEDNEVTAEARHVEQSVAGIDGSGDLLALRYSHRFGSALDLYGIGQVAVNHEGSYTDNDALTVGARYLARNQSSAGIELTSGDRGDSARIDGEYRLGEQHSLYAAYTYSPDLAESDSPFTARQGTGLTVGQRWRIS
ncbi:MAG: hypothetical protein ABI588_08150, partial [Arenimonas sp.]